MIPDLEPASSSSSSSSMDVDGHGDIIAIKESSTLRRRSQETRIPPPICVSPINHNDKKKRRPWTATSSSCSPSPSHHRYLAPTTISQLKCQQRKPLEAKTHTATRDTSTNRDLKKKHSNAFARQSRSSPANKSTRIGPVLVTPTREHPPMRSTKTNSIPTSLHIPSYPPFLAKVYLIRHGESMAQLAPPAQRLSDESLIDCPLSRLGLQQALALQNHPLLPNKMDLVLCSPLTRALQTACGAFPSTNNIVVHYDLRELGRAPESQPRSWSRVLPDLLAQDSARIDYATLYPKHYQWPDQHHWTPRVLRKEQVSHIFQWLAQELHQKQQQLQASLQPFRNVAVVCHYHVIRAALADARGFCAVQPQNAQPIECWLTNQGQLLVASPPSQSKK